MRTEIALLLLSVLVLSSLPVVGAYPEQVHTTEIGETLSVTWALPGRHVKTLDAGRVEYGPTPALGSIATGRWIAALDDAPYPTPDPLALATIYRAYVPRPLDGAPVHYRIVDYLGHVSQTFTYEPIPRAAQNYRVALYGDQGAGDEATAWSHDIVSTLLTEDPDLVLVAGDLGYADFNDQRLWNDWFRMLQPLAATKPFYAAVGNHERNYGVDPYRQFNARFDQPRDKQNFALDVGPLHVLVLNSQEMCVEGDGLGSAPLLNPPCARPESAPNLALMQYIRDDLASPAAQDAAWVVVVFHHTPYSHGQYADGTSGGAYLPWLRANWLPIFEEGGVDLVVAAHDHQYARTYPLLGNVTTTTALDGYVEGAGIPYVTTGGGGRPPYSPHPSPMPPQIALVEGAHHFTVVEANATTLRVEVTRADGTTLDAFSVTKASGATEAEDERAPFLLPLVPLVLVPLVLRRQRA